MKTKRIPKVVTTTETEAAIPSSIRSTILTSITPTTQYYLSTLGNVVEDEHSQQQLQQQQQQAPCIGSNHLVPITQSHRIPTKKESNNSVVVKEAEDSVVASSLLHYKQQTHTLFTSGSQVDGNIHQRHHYHQKSLVGALVLSTFMTKEQEDDDDDDDDDDDEPVYPQQQESRGYERQRCRIDVNNEVWSELEDSRMVFSKTKKKKKFHQPPVGEIILPTTGTTGTTSSYKFGQPPSIVSSRSIKGQATTTAINSPSVSVVVVAAPSPVLPTPFLQSHSIGMSVTDKPHEYSCNGHRNVPMILLKNATQHRYKVEDESLVVATPMCIRPGPQQHVQQPQKQQKQASSSGQRVLSNLKIVRPVPQRAVEAFYDAVAAAPAPAPSNSSSSFVRRQDHHPTAGGSMFMDEESDKDQPIQYEDVQEALRYSSEWHRKWTHQDETPSLYYNGNYNGNYGSVQNAPSHNNSKNVVVDTDAMLWTDLLAADREKGARNPSPFRSYRTRISEDGSSSSTIADDDNQYIQYTGTGIAKGKGKANGKDNGGSQMSDRDHTNNHNTKESNGGRAGGLDIFVVQQQRHNDKAKRCKVQLEEQEPATTDPSHLNRVISREYSSTSFSTLSSLTITAAVGVNDGTGMIPTGTGTGPGDSAKVIPVARTSTLVRPKPRRISTMAAAAAKGDQISTNKRCKETNGQEARTGRPLAVLARPKALRPSELTLSAVANMKQLQDRPLMPPVLQQHQDLMLDEVIGCYCSSQSRSMSPLSVSTLGQQQYGSGSQRSSDRHRHRHPPTVPTTTMSNSSVQSGIVHVIEEDDCDDCRGGMDISLIVSSYSSSWILESSLLPMVLISAKDGILQALAISGGDTSSSLQFTQCLAILQEHYANEVERKFSSYSSEIDDLDIRVGNDCQLPSSNVEDRHQEKKEMLSSVDDGTWLTLTKPTFFGNLGVNDNGDPMYTLGRMSFDMFSPTSIICSLQGNFNQVRLVSTEDRAKMLSNMKKENAKDKNNSHYSSVPTKFHEEIENGTTELKTYDIITPFTIEPPVAAFPNSPNQHVRCPIRAVMTTYGYTLPDPTIPGRQSVWITGGKIEPNNSVTDRQEWDRLFAMHPPKHAFHEKAKLLAVKLLMGATVPDHVDPTTGALDYTFTRPLGGHGMAYIETLYCDRTLRIVKGHRGTVFVFTRTS